MRLSRRMIPHALLTPVAVATLSLAVLSPPVQAQDDQTPARSLVDIRARAEAGDAEAQKNLGVMYAIGEGMPQDDAEAVAWFRKAAEQGHAEAQFILAEPSE